MHGEEDFQHLVQGKPPHDCLYKKEAVKQELDGLERLGFKGA
jgi:hypothetical protein